MLEDYGFTAFAVPTAVTTVFMAVFGTSLLLRKRSRVACSFFVLTLAASLWLFAFTLMYASREAGTALFWGRTAYLGIPFLAPAVYQFAIEMLRVWQRRRAVATVGWTLAVIWSVIGVSSSQLVPAVEHFWWGYYPRYTSAVSIPFLVFFVGYLIAALGELLSAYPRAAGIERRRIRLLLIGLGIAYLGCVDYMASFGFAVYPFGYLPVLAFVSIIARMLYKYDLAAITPSLAAPEIINTMADPLFVCDSENRIRVINRAAEVMLGYTAAEMIGRSIDELIERSDDNEQTFRSKSGELIDLTLSVAPVMYEGQAAGTVMIGRDVGDRKRYRLLFEQNAAGVCVMTAEGVITDCNRSFAELLHYSREELNGRRLRDLYVRPFEHDEIQEVLGDVPTLNSLEAELRRRDGSTIWLLQNLTRIGEGSTSEVHATLVDITDRKRAEEQIEFHAYHDILTNLPNRRLFADRLYQNLTHARRSGRPVAVMFIDIDHFKKINDTLGHTAGDELLLEMSQRLRNCVREEDTVARIGGDEFTIVLSELRHPEDAAAVAEKILAAIERPLEIAGHALEVTASIGISLYPEDGNDPESLLRNADSAMYRAKEAGRNTYQLCTEEMKQRAVDRLSLESRLRRAIAEERLIVEYQPQVSMTTGRIVGAEALVRWNDLEHGHIAPSHFIPIAEESRLILPLGEWVLRTACRQMRQWQTDGIAPSRLAVNLSARQFQQSGLVDMIREVLAETDLDAAALELEITETTAMQNVDATVDTLVALRSTGVTIAIDDFGTGYSSLSYLKRFPINAIKIDRSFVADVLEDSGDEAIIAAVLAIARKLRLRVIAEGVETQEQFAFLRKSGCDEAQGYYFSQPMKPAELARALIGPTIITTTQRFVI